MTHDTIIEAAARDAELAELAGHAIAKVFRIFSLNGLDPHVREAGEAVLAVIAPRIEAEALEKAIKIADDAIGEACGLEALLMAKEIRASIRAIIPATAAKESE